MWNFVSGVLTHLSLSCLGISSFLHSGSRCVVGNQVSTEPVKYRRKTTVLSVPGERWEKQIHTMKQSQMHAFILILATKHFSRGLSFYRQWNKLYLTAPTFFVCSHIYYVSLCLKCWVFGFGFGNIKHRGLFTI